MTQPTTSGIRSIWKSGKKEVARVLCEQLIKLTFPDREIAETRLIDSAYGLNSVYGFVTIDGENRFFKFHTEEHEDEFEKKAGSVEYYNSQLLSDVGLPVMIPVLSSASVGAQMSIYEVYDSPNLADFSIEIERQGKNHKHFHSVIEAQSALDRTVLECALETIKKAKNASDIPSIHQLFYARLVDSNNNFPGGRVLDFYLHDDNPIWDKRWRVNNVDYPLSLREIWENSSKVLDPSILQTGPVVTSHGDSHNGNLIAELNGDSVELTFYDPAFASSEIPALLAEVKATVHNTFLHPNYYYHSEDYDARCEIDESDEYMIVDYLWELNPLRKAYLESKIENFWIPLIGELHNRDLLPENWKEIISCAFACCPTLALNITEKNRNNSSKYTALAIAVMLGSGYLVENNVLYDFFTRIDPESKGYADVTR